MKTEEVYAQCQTRHTHREFLSFLRQFEDQTQASLDLHIVLDNYAAYKTVQVRRWLARHPRWHIHFISTHSSWLNQVERFFAKITQQRIRRGSFRSVIELRTAILNYINVHNLEPKPFRWRASAELVLGEAEKICHSLR